MSAKQNMKLLLHLARHPLLTEAEARHELGMEPPSPDREDISPEETSPEEDFGPATAQSPECDLEAA